MNIFKDSSFKGGRIQLDGTHYEGCNFEDCAIVYAGGQLPILINNGFSNCRWQFEGSAERTIAFMSQLYSGGATVLVEQMFEQIRRAAAEASK